MTLLEQLGGRDAVEAVVARFYERVLADGMLARFFRGVQMSRLSQHQVDFFVMVLSGGAENAYHGRNMVVAHAGMGITDEHFDRVAGHLVGTLQEFNVPQAGIQAVVALVAPLREQIVDRPKARVAQR